MQSTSLNQIEELSPFKVVNGKEVILLGNNEFLNDPANGELIDRKLNGEHTDQIPGFWGYVGYENQPIIDWTGTLKYSASGNEASQGSVLELIEQIHANHPDLSANDLKVTERFLSFDEVVFPLPEIAPGSSDLPNLELVLFLKPQNGALTLQQLYDDDELDLNNDSHLGNDWEPILPEPTPNHSFDRDRLHYIFEIDYPHELYEDDAGNLQFGAHVDDRFVVKLLTYQRTSGAQGSEGFIDEVKDRLLKVEERYELLYYDTTTQWFRPAQPGDIDPSLKTLLLLHGTFKCTDKSFAALKGGWIDQEILGKGKYKQVIAFDHASVFDNVQDNVNALMQRLRPLIDVPFAQRVNWIATSRGSLLAKHLINLNSRGGINDLLTMGDGIMVAGPGNGARIVDFIGSFRRAITVLKMILTPTGVGAVFVELLQHSAKFMTNQPGIKEQKINSPGLRAITQFPTPNPRVEILPIVGDFMSAKKLGKKIFGRVFFKVSDLVMRRKMGKHHDFVIRCKEQFDPIPYRLPNISNTVTGSSYRPGKYQTHMINSIHGSLLGEPKVRDQVSQYLNNLPQTR